jgi:hypothetical protein
MNSIHEFNHPLWVTTPKGDGLALFVIDYGIHINTCWVVGLEDHGWQVKHFDANDIKLCRNEAYGIK